MSQYIVMEKERVPSLNSMLMMYINVRIGELYYIVYRSWGLEAGDAAQP